MENSNLVRCENYMVTKVGLPRHVDIDNLMRKYQAPGNLSSLNRAIFSINHFIIDRLKIQVPTRQVLFRVYKLSIFSDIHLTDKSKNSYHVVREFRKKNYQSSKYNYFKFELSNLFFRSIYSLFERFHELGDNEFVRRRYILKNGELITFDSILDVESNFSENVYLVRSKSSYIFDDYKLEFIPIISANSYNLKNDLQLDET